MNLLQVQNATKSFGTKILFKNATFSVNEGEHIGLIGQNGTGKTTLFKILMARLELEEGQIIKNNKIKIAYLEQESDWNLNQTGESYLESVSEIPLWELKLKAESLGLSEQDLLLKLSSLSGGYRMRIRLLGLLGLRPNLMLLDEPTNFLDLETVLILERFLQGFEGAYLLISHDREFLKRTTDHIVEVETGDITKYPGNIDDYFEQKALLRYQLEKAAASNENKRKTIQDFVDRFGAKATKARQAQSRLKQLQKMEKIELKEVPLKAHIKIPAPTHTGKEVICVENVSLGYGSRIILQNINFRMNRGDHLGVVGFNGAGKSTFLKGLSGQILPMIGTIALGHEVSIGFFAQHSTDTLHPEETVNEALQRLAHSQVLQQEILNVAGSLLFSGDDLLKKIKVLSGGEKSRVALGQVLLQKAPVLLLDEPTNHLDFDTVEALTVALSKYEGSLIVISHDRGFISRVSNKIIEIKNGGAEFYPGTYEEYLWSLEKGMLKETVPGYFKNNEIDLKNVPAPEITKFNYKEEQKRIEKEITSKRQEIRKIEKRLIDLADLQSKATQELMTASGEFAKKKALELAHTSKEILNLEELLLSLMESLEDLEKALSTLGK